MRVIALDISSKTGYAIFDDGKPVAWGTIFPDKTPKDFGEYPFNYPEWAAYTIGRLFNEVITKYHNDDTCLVVEETNGSSKNNYSQKQLEFLHNHLLQALWADGIKKVFYVRTGEWRKAVNARLSKEEKSLNSKISRIKKKTGKKLAKIDGKVVGRKGRKHVSIRVVGELLGIELQRKDEDTADALLLGLGYLRGAPVADGTTTGGKSSNEKASN